jgi:hypothetical protein
MPTYTRNGSNFGAASKTGTGNNWTNEGNILADDASNASSAYATQYLVASSPNESWLVGPPGGGENATGNATLSSLTIEIQTAVIVGGTGTMELYQNGSLVTTKTYTLNGGGGSQSQTWTGDNTYWGLTITDIFSLSTISVRFRATGGSGTVQCDFIGCSYTISQVYTSGGGGGRRRAIYVAKMN